jgi:hypothetical protein
MVGHSFAGGSGEAGAGQEENSSFDSIISLPRPMCFDYRDGQLI